MKTLAASIDDAWRIKSNDSAAHLARLMASNAALAALEAKSRVLRPLEGAQKRTTMAAFTKPRPLKLAASIDAFKTKSAEGGAGRIRVFDAGFSGLG